MMDSDWRELFQPWILERGRNYHAEGLVHNLHIDFDCITADVEGTDDYEVEIFLDEDMVVEMTCTCPYAEDGTSCKHMAAVLFAAEAEEQVSDTPSKAECNRSQPILWRETLEQLSAEQMREFLTSIICNDMRLQELIVLRYREQNPELLKDSWEEQIHEIVRRYSDRRGYIDYVHADDFHSDLDDFLCDRIPTLLHASKILQAFELVSLVFVTAMEEGADDSGGVLNTLVDTCENYWQSILALASEQEQRSMHQWFAEHLFTTTWCFGPDFIENFLFSYDWIHPLLELNLKLLDRIAEQNKDNDSYLEGILRWREDTMRRLNCSDAEIDFLWQQYRQYPFARTRELNRYVDTKNYEHAIELLLEGKRIDADKPWCIKRHSEKLIELYNLTGQTEAYRNELKFQIFNCHQHDLEYIKLLRSATPDSEWKELLESILTLPSTRELLCPLLAYDGQWPRLFETIQKTRSLSLLNQYSSALYQWAPEKVLNCYLDLMDNAMYHASDRKAYRSVIGFLSQIVQYPGGKKVVQTLITSWRSNYPRRSAMLDEISKAGFEG